MVTEYSTIGEIAGPLILLDNVDHATYEELVEVELPDGELRRGKVLEVDPHPNADAHSSSYGTWQLMMQCKLAKVILRTERQ